MIVDSVIASSAVVTSLFNINSEPPEEVEPDPEYDPVCLVARSAHLILQCATDKCLGPTRFRAGYITLEYASQGCK